MKKILLLTLILVLPTHVFAGRDPLRKVSKNIGKKVQKLEKPRVGILAFPYHDGKVSSGSSIISERLTTQMVNVKGVRIVERNLIRKVLEEQRLSETGVIDPKTAKRLGQILGVDVLITGTLIDLNDGETEVNARGVLADTGEVIAASRVVIERTWKDWPKHPETLLAEDEEVVAEVEKVDDDEPIEIGYPAAGPSYGGRGFRGGFGRRYR